MNARSHQLDIGGPCLRQFDWLPADPPRGAAILVHGQGDCAERHATTVEPLLERGIACTAVDLPGHGHSPGQRGHIPGFDTVGRILTHARSAFEQRIGFTVKGWVAHSMGGLLAIHHVSRLTQPTPRYLWLSSPLIDPGAGRSWFMHCLTRCFGGVFPRIPLRTGVRASDCREADERQEPDRTIMDELGHDRITLGWASALLRLGDSLPSAVAALDRSIRVLVTQGLDDPICPPDFARRFFDQLPQESKRWIGLPGARHEPFADSNADELKKAVATWLDEEVFA